MDERVSRLIEDLESNRIVRPDGGLDSEALRDRIIALHREVEDEDSRVELIALHAALMGTSERGLIEEGRDPAELRHVWQEDYFSFLVVESIVGGEIDQERLVAVREREVAAGRLGADQFLHVAKVEREAEPEAPEPAADPVEPARRRSGEITMDDYPAAALRAGEEGKVVVAFLVGTDGRVADISVESSSGSNSLDAATCRLIRNRFRYAPARGADGRPVPQSLRQSVVWRLEDDDAAEEALPPPGLLSRIGRLFRR